jgi:outer membrane biosynthesis protein TonB
MKGDLVDSPCGGSWYGTITPVGLNAGRKDGQYVLIPTMLPVPGQPSLLDLSRKLVHYAEAEDEEDEEVASEAAPEPEPEKDEIASEAEKETEPKEEETEKEVMQKEPEKDENARAAEAEALERKKAEIARATAEALEWRKMDEIARAAEAEAQERKKDEIARAKAEALERKKAETEKEKEAYGGGGFFERRLATKVDVDVHQQQHQFYSGNSTAADSAYVDDGKSTLLAHALGCLSSRDGDVEKEQRRREIPTNIGKALRACVKDGADLSLVMSIFRDRLEARGEHPSLILLEEAWTSLRTAFDPRHVEALSEIIRSGRAKHCPSKSTSKEPWLPGAAKLSKEAEKRRAKAAKSSNDDEDFDDDGDLAARLARTFHELVRTLKRAATESAVGLLGGASASLAVFAEAILDATSKSNETRVSSTPFAVAVDEKRVSDEIVDAWFALPAANSQEDILDEQVSLRKARIGAARDSLRVAMRLLCSLRKDARALGSRMAERAGFRDVVQASLRDMAMCLFDVGTQPVRAAVLDTFAKNGHPELESAASRANLLAFGTTSSSNSKKKTTSSALDAIVLKIASIEVASIEKENAKTETEKKRAKAEADEKKAEEKKAEKKAEKKIARAEKKRVKAEKKKALAEEAEEKAEAEAEEKRAETEEKAVTLAVAVTLALAVTATEKVACGYFDLQRQLSSFAKQQDHQYCNDDDFLFQANVFGGGARAAVKVKAAENDEKRHPEETTGAKKNSSSPTVIDLT